MDRFLERDASVRILAITLALLLWFLGMNQQNPVVQRSFAIPVQYGEVGPGLALISLSPQAIAITVEGRQSVLDGLSEADFAAVADLRPAEPGVSQLPIKVSVVAEGRIGWGARALRIVDHEPRNVEIAVDDIETRLIDVDIRVVGNPHPDYVADAVRLESAAIEVTAPHSVLQAVHRLTGTIDIEGIESTVNKLVSLRAVDFGGREVRGVQVESSDIEVTIPIRARPPANTVAVKTELQGSLEVGFRVVGVVVEPLLVTLRAPSDRIHSIDAVSTQPISIGGRSSTFTETVALVTPSGVVWQSHQQVEVTVLIEEDLIERTLTGISLRPQNLASGYSWFMEPTMVDVRLKGRRDLIDKLTEGMLDATFDAQGLTEGTHEVRITVAVPDGVQYEVRPAQVQLTLQQRN